MKKKMIAVLVLLLVISTASVFALGIGAQAGYVAGTEGANGAVTFKTDSSDLLFAVSGDYWGSGLQFGISADKWLANKSFAKPFNYFYGVGAAGGAYLSGNSVAATVAGRLVAGVNVFLLDGFLEVYLQGAWQPGIKVGLGNEARITPLITVFPVNLGFRFWLQ